jgi:hypothetical protein
MAKEDGNLVWVYCYNISYFFINNKASIISNLFLCPIY